MGFQDKNYQFQIVDALTKEAITSGVSVYVYDNGTRTLSTVYSNAVRGSFTNPVTFSAFSNFVEFWSSAASHDIFVADNLGNVRKYIGVTPNVHTIELDRSGVNKCFVFPFAANAAETDTGLDFPLDVWIYSAMIEVITADSGQTIDVGLLSSETAGDADGILAAVTLANTGFVTPFSVTVGSSENFIASPYWGALMGVGSAGTDAANDFGQPGGHGHIVTGSNARSLVYDGSTSIDTGVGYGYVFFRHLR